jgi:hypothetical protein
MQNRKIRGQVGWILGLVLAGQVAHAQIDHLQIVVDRTPASGTNSLGAAGYDAGSNAVFSSTFGAGLAIRRITDVDGADVSQVMVNENQIQIITATATRIAA